MNRPQKIVIFVAAAALLLVALTGCSKNASNDVALPKKAYAPTEEFDGTWYERTGWFQPIAIDEPPLPGNIGGAITMDPQ